jgi:hypothetical protein
MGWIGREIEPGPGREGLGSGVDSSKGYLDFSMNSTRFVVCYRLLHIV